MVTNIEKIFENISANPNKKKIENATNSKNNIDITKELISKYFIATSGEYNWLATQFNEKYVDKYIIDKRKQKRISGYEHTLEYKIKHPIVVVLRKLHLYEGCMKIIRRRK